MTNSRLLRSRQMKWRGSTDADIIAIADPAVRLYRRWRRTWHGATAAEDDYERAALADESSDLAWKIAATRARTLAGIAAKVRLVLEAGDDLIVQGCYSRELIESALADLERMGGY